MVYIDSLGCAACKLKLVEWKCFLDTCQKMSYDIGCLFVIQSTDYRIIEQQQRISSFNYPIIYDTDAEFDKLNNFPKDPNLHTFLLDENDKVVLIGSPLNSERMRELYYDVISGRIKEKVQNLEADNIETHRENVTSISVVRDSVNMGNISSFVIKCVNFQLRNIGSKPLLIYSANTSCGCTAAKYDKKPIPPGKTTTVTLEYKPNSLGYFHKTADVVCNIPEGFVRLSISGTVVEK